MISSDDKSKPQRLAACLDVTTARFIAEIALNKARETARHGGRRVADLTQLDRSILAFSNASFEKDSTAKVYQFLEYILAAIDILQFNLQDSIDHWKVCIIFDLLLIMLIVNSNTTIC